MSAFRAAFFALFLGVAGPLLAQGQAFGAGSIDPDDPVEVESDSLNVNQSDGTAEFIGNVVIIQGEMRLAAPRVLVVYDDAGERITSMEATGGVTLVSGPDAAEAQTASYSIDSGKVVMTGDVLVTQGQSTLASQTLTVDLGAGTAQMDGRVRTILNPKD
ncbi:lipopolysaccharide transport periplasmic protein LptA [Pseudooceanicola sp. C21-150M6]|uniref:lipopolysaccharide transport periplasmic protein LptA n=1 Tax=Pseudooceanicola sp. C21-150M6 TaxID=3434355 RepID=UPI003D7F861A